MGRLFVVGTLNVDSVVAVQQHPEPGETVMGGQVRTFFGGKGANQAVAAAGGADAPAAGHVVFIGRVGADQPGRNYRERLSSFGIDVEHLLDTEGVPTGSAMIAVSEAGENTIIVSSGANARVHPDDLTALTELRTDDVVLTTLELPLSVVSAVAAHAEAAGARFVFNLSPFTDIPTEIVQRGDPVVVNEHEAQQLSAKYGRMPSVLITRGAGGSEWNGIHVPVAGGIDVVDTTGAGDAYTDTLAMRLAIGDDSETAMRVATEYAGKIVARHGAQ